MTNATPATGTLAKTKVTDVPKQGQDGDDPHQQRKEKERIQEHEEDHPLPPQENSSLYSVDVTTLLANLTAGVESNDDAMVLGAIEDGREESVVLDVLEKVPVQIVVPLLKILKRCVSKKTTQTTLHLFWLEHLIQEKLTFLLSVDGLKEELKSLLEMLNIRMEVFERVLKLRGRLNLLMSQVSKQNQSNDNPPIVMQRQIPLIEYRDSSDDEDENDEESVSSNQGDEEVDGDEVDDEADDEEIDGDDDESEDEEEASIEGNDDDDQADADEDEEEELEMEMPAKKKKKILKSTSLEDEYE